jgi:hypothetical protein
MKSYRTAIENLENRRLLTTLKGTDLRNIAASDGTKENGNDVVVRFDGPIQSFNIANMRMFGYSNNTLQGGQTKTTINIKSATIEGNNLVLRTDVQIRKGSTLTLNSGAVTASDGGVTGTIRTNKGLNRDRFTLALRAFQVRDKTMFSADRIAGGVTPITANTAESEATVRADLVAFLGKKVSGGFINAAKRDDALARFDSSTNESLVPDHNLRAAIVSLVGTIGEPAIAYYFEKANSTGKDLIEFGFNGASFSSGARISETTYTSTGRLKTVWNPNYEGESFVVLSGLVAHETIHEGREDFGGSTNVQVNSRDEEVIANTVEGFIWAQQIVADFNYAREGTELTTRANYRLFAMLNSGDRQFPRVGIKEAPLKNPAAGAVPGLTPPVDFAPVDGIVSFADDIREEMDSRSIGDKLPTQTFATARAILTNLTGNTYDNDDKFGDALIDDIDIGQDVLSDAFAMRVARVLQVSV